MGELSFLETRVEAVTETEVTVQSGDDAGVCVGDSGAALLYRENGESPYRLIGILSRRSTFCRGRDLFVNAQAIAEAFQTALAL